MGMDWRLSPASLTYENSLEQDLLESPSPCSFGADGLKMLPSDVADPKSPE